VREALRALTECGLVRTERNRGAFVREVSLAEADEAYDVREVLDELIGRRLAERITAPQLVTLRTLLGEMDAATAKQDIGRYHELTSLPRGAVDFVGNSRRGAYRRLTKSCRCSACAVCRRRRFAVSNAEHAIVGAIARRDPERRAPARARRRQPARMAPRCAAAPRRRGPAEVRYA
jgi:DNA-binding GntR family transcriptional regulator